MFVIVLAFVLVGCSGNDSSSNTEEDVAVDYSKNPLKIIVPWASGGLTDATARLLSEEVVDYLPEGSKIVVENRPGASGGIGSTEVANAKPDGHTVLLSPLVPIIEIPQFGQVTYDYKDFDPIIQLLSTPLVFAVNADSEIKTYEEFVEYSKENPSGFSYGSPGAGTLEHITMEKVSAENDISIEHVPYEGTAPMISDILGGHVDGGLMQIPDLVPHLKEGTIRLLWNSGSEGFPHLPEDTPTLKDLGIDITMNGQTSILAPDETPDEIKEMLEDAFKQALESEKFIEKMENANFEPSYESSADLEKIIEERYELNSGIIEDLGITLTD